MLKKSTLLILSLLILSILLLTSCFLNPPVTEGILKGQILIPEGTLKSKDLTGQALPDATVNIIDLTTGSIIATTTTDATGHYQVSVPPGGPYLLEAVKGTIKLEQMTCSVEVGIEYDLGNADCATTAAALIAQAMMDAGENPADIDCAAIMADSHFSDVSSIVCGTIKAGQDPTTSSGVEQAVEEFLNPTTPAPTPAPTLTYTVTFDSQGGSAVDSQTVNHGEKATEPTAPTWAGYTFGGWYKESGCTNTWDFATDTVISDVTLYAKWMGSVHNITQDTYYTTIQAALDAANSSDSIIADDGNYSESITFPYGWLITLKSLNGASSTFITGVDGSATVTCSDCQEGTALEGFTVTHNSGDTGRGITIANITAGYLAIKNCTVTNNSVFDDYAGGIYNEKGTVTITNSEISDNSAKSPGYDGGGIYNDHGTLTITNSEISENSTKGHAGGIHHWYGTLTITGSTISENTASDSDGGGIYNEEGTVTITDSIISSNLATGSGGGGIYNEATLTITDSTISENSAVDGGGIYHWYGTLTITGSTISGNTATNDAGGIYNHGTLTITGCTISGNTAVNFGGGVYIYDSSPTIGGVDGSDTANFNSICGNIPDQVNPDSYPNNYIFTNCDVIGETGPAGGIIFYDKGSVSDGWRYLEAAPSLWNGGSADPDSVWSNVISTLVGTTGTEIGKGLVNTDAIIAQSGHTASAAKLCRDYAGGGKTDWFLPSKDELNMMYTNLKLVGVGGFVALGYWSSSEDSESLASAQDFGDGFYDGCNKSNTYRVRAVRAF